MTGAGWERPPPGARRRRLAAGAGALAAALVVGWALGSAPGNPGAETRPPAGTLPVDAGDPTASPVRAAATAAGDLAIGWQPRPLAPPLGRWQLMATGPLRPRSGAVAAWTGSEVLVWGGLGDRKGGGALALGDGAAYDPDRDRWRRLPDGPLSPRHSAAGVWTGTELVVWGGAGRGRFPGTLSDGAAYDPVTDRWRRLAPAPLSGRAVPAVVWTGEDVVIWGGSGPGSTTRSDGASYDPLVDRWRRLPDGPLRRRAAPAAVWSGHEMLIWGGEAARGPGSHTAAAYDPSVERWRVLPPAGTGALARLFADDGTVVAWGPLFGLRPGEALLRLEPDVREWRRNAPTPPGPPAGSAGWSRRIPASWLGARNAVPIHSRGARGVPTPPTGRWRGMATSPLTTRDEHVQLWAGDRLVVWGGRGVRAALGDGAVWAARR